MPGERAVGIDLGTTRTTVAVVDDGEARVLKNQNGDRSTPSAVRFEETDDEQVEMVVEYAGEGALLYPETTVWPLRRLGEDGVEVHGREYTPTEVTTELLRYVLVGAERRLGEHVDEAVVAVPAHIEAADRVVREAGEALDVDLSPVARPTAAWFAAAAARPDDGGADRVVGYDLAGDTFTTSLLVREPDESPGAPALEEAITLSDLGDRDWDGAVVDWMAETIEADTGVDVRTDDEQLSRLHESARTARADLAEEPTTEIVVPYVAPTESGYHLQEELTRQQYEDLTADLLERTVDACDRLLETAGLTPEEVDGVIRSGETTRLPGIERAVEERVGQVLSTGDPATVVARGAALRAASGRRRRSGGDEKSHDNGGGSFAEWSGVEPIAVLPRPIGIETHHGYEVLVPGGELLPVSGVVTLTSVRDHDGYVVVRVYEGPGPADDPGTVLAGQAVLSDLPDVSAGDLRVRVDLTVREDGSVAFSATELDTNTPLETTFEPV
jgi:molecular chaperone DnaK